MSAAPRPSPGLPPAVAAIVADAKAGLAALYGDRLDRVVLYGSYARGDACPDSDVDLIVVLHGDVQWYDELCRLDDVRMGLLLRYETPVSIQPYAESDYHTPQTPFMENVRQDGCLV